jgi:hypothetical protein
MRLYASWSIIKGARIDDSVDIFVYGGVIARFDPAYSDARGRAAALGEFNFFSAWMSQPKSQLETFRSWAGKDSDIRSVLDLLGPQSTKCHFVQLLSFVSSH